MTAAELSALWEPLAARCPELRRHAWRVVADGECMVWTGAKDQKGYGQIRYKGFAWRVHRLVWTIANGSIPSGKVVCHRCDNPRCVRPDHLFIGTVADNQQDMARKGRSIWGERNPQAKLGLREVAGMRARYLAGGSCSEIARCYGVSRQAVSDIVNGRRWNSDHALAAAVAAVLDVKP